MGTGGNEPVSGMLYDKDVRRLFSGRVRRGRGSAVDGALVEAGRESDCRAVLHKGRENCGDSWPESYEVCVIGVINCVHGRVRSSNSLKGSWSTCAKRRGPKGSRWRTPRADVMSTVPDSLSEKRTVD
jgi:hypothetical protein